MSSLSVGKTPSRVLGAHRRSSTRIWNVVSFFVGMMYKEWGTPPGAPSTYTSGFEEEFESSVLRRRSTGKPEISLLLKDVEPEALRDPGPKLTKVLAFKNKIASERNLTLRGIPRHT